MKPTMQTTFIFLFFFHFFQLQAQHEQMYAYFLRTYQEICLLSNDDPKKIQELNVLLAQVESYYEGLSSAYYPSGKLAWVVLCGLGSQCFAKDSIFAYCFCIAALANALAFCYDASIYTHNVNTKSELFACLNSLQAAIQERLDQKKKSNSN